MNQSVGPRSTANPSPVRRPGSIRRTTSIDVSWAEGITGPRSFEGRARDIVRRDDGRDVAAAEARMDARITFDRMIAAMSATPAPEGIEKLVGERGGSHLRGVLGSLFPQMVSEGWPLYLLLDDISGTSLICNWAWSQWGPQGEDDWAERMNKMEAGRTIEQVLLSKENVCWGFKSGSPSLSMDVRRSHSDAADGKDLRNPADPDGWHQFPQTRGPVFRRARRIDVWREADCVRIEAAFQDSAPRETGGRSALHEYIVHVRLDPATLEIVALDPEPRVLPFAECPGAIANSQKLVGTPLPQVRETVLEHLRGPVGCTHLNDALRALAEVPRLLERLDAELVAA